MNIKDRIRNFSDERWCLGIVESSLNDVLNGKEIKVQWVKDRHRNRWFADPFILSANKREIVVLCEEMYKPRGVKKGRISKVVIDRESNSITDVVCLLQLDTHLSFPIYYRKNGEVYVYPENGEAGGLTLYRYNQSDERLEPIQELCNEPVADAVITDLFGKRLMFCTKQPDPNGKNMFIYEWNENKQLFDSVEVKSFDENLARMSGQFFEYKGKIYRPTQECNVQYGHAVTIQEVKKNNDNLDFVELRRIYSTHPYLKTGCHTFNVFDENLIIVDALGFDRMWFRKLLRFFRILK